MSKKIEFFLPLVLVPLHGLLYNSVGPLVTAGRGVDFGPWVESPLDSLVPFVPVMVLPYMLAWIYPAILVVGLVARHEPVGIGVVRRIVVALIVLEFVCYCLWIAFPVSVSLRLDAAALEAHGWLGGLVQLNYDTATVWHACPSFHIAGPWFFYRAAQLYRVPCLRLMFVLFVAIAISTVTIRIHYLADIVAGLLVSEMVFRFVLRRLEQRKAFDPPKK